MLLKRWQSAADSHYNSAASLARELCTCHVLVLDADALTALSPPTRVWSPP